ncbi:MAG: GntR family transcriptional regulator [Stellaceae bacterium]
MIIDDASHLVSRDPANGPSSASGLINRHSLHREVTDRLRDMIVEGHLGDGAKLNESDIAQLLGVSRTPVREALKVLGSEGLVELSPGRGACVTRVSAEEARELFEVVSGLERHAVEIAARRIEAGNMATLREMHDRMTAHFLAKRRHEYFILNHRIHNFLVALSGNATLRATHASLMTRVRRERYMALEGARWPEAMREHDLLMGALTRGDSAAAGEIMLRHVLHTSDALAATLAQDRARAGDRDGPQ